MRNFFQAGDRPDAKRKESLTAPLILSLETATMGGSVFVGRGPLQLAASTGDPQVSQSNSLLNDIDSILQAAGLSLSEVDLFACASGPGSFTGLRIGIATVKGLAATLDRPCIGIPTLKAVAHSAPSIATVALLPAGRGELFAQMFFGAQHQTVSEIDAAAHLSPQRLVERYGGFKDLTWAGPGAHQHRDFLEKYAEQAGIPFVECAPDSQGYRPPRPAKGWSLAAREKNLAGHVAALALQLCERGELQSAESLHAIYVRPSDAELKEQCR